MTVVLPKRPFYIEILTCLSHFLVKVLTQADFLCIVVTSQAAIAQLVEHVICNLGVQGSSPCGGLVRDFPGHGEFPEWSKGADCKSVGSSFVGPNPSLPILKPEQQCSGFFYLS